MCRRPFTAAFVALFVVCFVPLAASIYPAALRAQTQDGASGVQQMLRLFELREDDTAAEVGARLAREHPDDAEIQALYVIARSRQEGEEAAAASVRNLERWPDDAWTWATHAAVQLFTDTIVNDGPLAAAARARELAPEDPEIAMLVAPVYGRWAREELISMVDSFIAAGSATADLRVARAYEMAGLANRPCGPRTQQWGCSSLDTVLYRQAMQEFEAIRAEWPSSPSAYLEAGNLLLGEGRVAEALHLLERAVALSPNSNRVRSSYWSALAGRPVRWDPRVRATDLPVSGRNAIVADMEAFLEIRRHAVGALFEVAQYARWEMPDRAASTEDLILREHPETWQAAAVELDRVRDLRNSISQMSAGEGTLASAQYLTSLRALTTRPGASRSQRRWASNLLLVALVEDSASPGEEVWSVYQALEGYLPPAMQGQFTALRYKAVPEALAERGTRFIEAEALARRGLEWREADLEEWGPQSLSVALFADRLDRMRTEAHSTIGWVRFHAGDLVEARRELERAHETWNTNGEAVYRLGRVAEAAGHIEEAERWYALGSGLGQLRWGDYREESLAALERLYREGGGSRDGFADYLAAVEVRETARLKEQVEAARIADPQPMPAFQLEWLHGGERFSSASLHGKIAVINFWGVWCGPCVREAPHIQEFADKFKDHPDVVFLTIANDNDPDVTRAWMEEQGYDFPVLLEGRDPTRGGQPKLVANQSGMVGGYPTTLFLDPGGQVVFRAPGASARLVDEYTWRVEAMREEGAPSEETAPGRTLEHSAPAAAVHELLHRLELRDEYGAAELASQLAGRYPDDPIVQALRVIALGNAWAGTWPNQRVPSEQNLERWPQDAWTNAAFAIAHAASRTDEALAAAARARALEPENVELAAHLGRVYVRTKPARMIAIADSLLIAGLATAGLRTVRADHLLVLSNWMGRDSALYRQGMEELAAVRAAWPASPGAYLLEGRQLMRAGRVGEAERLLSRAVELSPRSAEIRNAYWPVLNARADLPLAERQALVGTDMDGFLEQRGHDPNAQATVMWYLWPRPGILDVPQRALSLSDRIVAEHPGSPEAAEASWARANVLRDSVAALSGPDSVAALRRHQANLRQLLERPGADHVRNPTYGLLLESLASDDTVGGEALWAVMQEHDALYPVTVGDRRLRHLLLPQALAERGVRFQEAEARVRGWMEWEEARLEQERERDSTSVTAYAERLDRIQADGHAALGWILLHGGDLQGARLELTRAYETAPESYEVLYRLGRLEEVSGDLSQAEDLYLFGGVIEQRRPEGTEGRNRLALERLYRGRHGEAGLDDYLASMDRRATTRLRAKVLSERAVDPRPVPPFELEWLHGGERFGSAALSGKLAVINFWGVWCGPCVREAPHIQEFADRFAGHPEVVFLTIANDQDPEVTRRWLESEGYDFPVLLEARNRPQGRPNGVASENDVLGYPTTLFLDRERRIAFRARGASLRLVDEYTWRVEALLGAAGEEPLSGGAP